MGQCLCRQDDRTNGFFNNTHKKQKKLPSNKAAVDATETTVQDEVHTSHLAFLTSPTGQQTVATAETTASPHPSEQQQQQQGSNNNNNEGPWIPYDDLGARKKKKKQEQPKQQQAQKLTWRRHKSASAPPPSAAFTTPLVGKDFIIVEERDPEAPSDEESFFSPSQQQQPTPMYHHQFLHRHHQSISSSSTLTGEPTTDSKGAAVQGDAYEQFQQLRLQAEEQRVVVGQRSSIKKLDDSIRKSPHQNTPARASTNRNSKKNTLELLLGRLRRNKKRSTEDFSSSSSDEDLDDDDEKSQVSLGATPKQPVGRLVAKPEQHTVQLDSLAADHCDQTNFSSASNLSESSLDAQRRLFALKARQRQGKGKRQVVPPPNRPPTPPPPPPDDYGPVRKGAPQSARRMSWNNKASEEKSVLETSPESMEVCVKHNPLADDASLVSDLGDDYSVSFSAHSGFIPARSHKKKRTTTTTTPFSDYGVVRKSKHQQKVDPRFERMLRQQQRQQQEFSPPKSPLADRLAHIEQALSLSPPERKALSPQSSKAAADETPIKSNTSLASRDAASLLAVPTAPDLDATPPTKTTSRRSVSELSRAEEPKVETAPPRSPARALMHLLTNSSPSPSQRKKPKSSYGSPAGAKPVVQKVTTMSTTEFLNYSDEASELELSAAAPSSPNHSFITAASPNHSFTIVGLDPAAAAEDNPMDYTAQDMMVKSLKQQEDSTTSSNEAFLAILRTSSHDDTAQSSLELAEQVEAQVEDVLSKFRARDS